MNEELIVGPKDIDAVALDPVVYAPDGNYYRLGERRGKGYQMGASLKKGY